MSSPLIWISVKHGLVLFTFGNASGIDRETNQGRHQTEWRELRRSHLAANGRLLARWSRCPPVRFGQSSDLDTHLHLYREFPAIGGIAHTHSTYATTWAQAGLAIPALRHNPMPTTSTAPVPCTSAAFTDEEVLWGLRFEHPVKPSRASSSETISIPSPFRLFSSAGTPRSAGDAPLQKRHTHAVILENVAELAWRTRLLNPQITPVSQALLDRHYQRKHGPQGHLRSVSL